MGKFDLSKFKNFIAPAGVVLFACLILLAANIGTGDVQRGGIALDAGNTKSREEIQAELDAAGLESGVELYINSNIVMANGKATANLLIQNSEHNRDDQQVYIYLPSDDSSDSDSDILLYKSDIIPAGYKVESAKLKSNLDAGEYDCRAEFHVLDSSKNDKAVINTRVKITVLK